MSSDLEFVEALVDEVLDLLAPLEDSFSSLDAFDATLLDFGWVPPERSDYLTALKSALGTFVDVAAIGTAFDAFTAKPGIDTASAALDAVGRALGSMRTPDPGTIASQLPAPLNSSNFWEAFLRQLGDALFIDWLRRRMPKPFALLHLTGIVDIRQVVPTGQGRVPYRARVVHWESLGEAIVRPDKLLNSTYG